jgi:MurNAc alpha-1-phosphate uridylyltransferase
MSGKRITHAMVLAAGMGNRMRHLTNGTPKPLVRLGGRALIDHVLDGLGDAGVRNAVVNVHYLADQIEAHVANRTHPRIAISDERGELLDTGGGVYKALPLLGEDAFFVHNSDSVWVERGPSTLLRMMDAWNPATMDALLLMAPKSESVGHEGLGDFEMDENGILTPRAGRDQPMPYIYAGVAIYHPRLFAESPEGAFSVLKLWNNARAAGRLAGIRHDGIWMHVGTPEALASAEKCLASRAA